MQKLSFNEFHTLILNKFHNNEIFLTELLVLLNMIFSTTIPSIDDIDSKDVFQSSMYHLEKLLWMVKIST